RGGGEPPTKPLPKRFVNAANGDAAADHPNGARASATLRTDAAPPFSPARARARARRRRGRWRPAAAALPDRARKPVDAARARLGAAADGLDPPGREWPRAVRLSRTDRRNAPPRLRRGRPGLGAGPAAMGDASPLRPGRNA